MSDDGFPGLPESGPSGRPRPQGGAPQPTPSGPVRFEKPGARGRGPGSAQPWTAAPTGNPAGGLGGSAPAENGGVRFDKPGPDEGWMPSGPPSPVLEPVERPTYELASWGRRAAAATIDAAIVLTVTIVPVVAVVTNLSWDTMFTENTRGYQDVMEMMFGLFAATLLFLVVLFLYTPVWMWRTSGRTLGKQMLGIRVVRADGQPMTFWYAVFREFLVKGVIGSVGSSFTLYLYGLVDVLWPLWDSENRAIHDYIASSRVIRG